MISQSYFNKVKNYFNGDTAKTWLWFQMPNPGLGGVVPLDMIKCGRENKLKEFIDTRLAENYR